MLLLDGGYVFLHSVEVHLELLFCMADADGGGHTAGRGGAPGRGGLTVGAKQAGGGHGRAAVEVGELRSVLV